MNAYFAEALEEAVGAENLIVGQEAVFVFWAVFFAPVIVLGEIFGFKTQHEIVRFQDAQGSAAFIAHRKGNPFPAGFVREIPLLPDPPPKGNQVVLLSQNIAPKPGRPAKRRLRFCRTSCGCRSSPSPK